MPSDGSTTTLDGGPAPEKPQTPTAVDGDKNDGEKPRPPPPSGAPDGGTRAWLVVLGAWCTSFCSFGWINSVGVFQEYYQAHMLPQYTASEISWIPSLQIFFMMGMGPIIGILYDKFGPRHLILVGTAMHVFGLMMASISHSYYQILLSQGVCSAIGVSAIFQPALNTIPGWFDKRRGAAFGLLATGSSLGGVIFPIMVARLIDELSFGWAMRISGFLILALLVVANLTVKAYRPPIERKLTLHQFIKPFTEVKFLLLAIGVLLFTFGLYVPIDYIPVEAASAGMRPGLVEYLVPILNAASLFGRAGSGFAGDKIGRYNVFIIVCYLTGVWILALWIPAVNDGARIAFAALFGFSSGAYVAILPALVVQISPMSEIGFRVGLSFLACALPGLTTNPIGGAILDRTSSWVEPKVFAGVMAIAGTSFVLAARIKATGWKLNAVF